MREEIRHRIQQPRRSGDVDRPAMVVVVIAIVRVLPTRDTTKVRVLPNVQAHLLKGWRRFGRAFFHPVCKGCHECRSVRVPVLTFKPDRSQRRALKTNTDVELVIGQPAVTEEKLRLYDTVDAKVMAWQTGKESNIRALLSSLDLILWPEAGWTKVNMAQLVVVNKVKIVYMKAIAKVHPDKVTLRCGLGCLLCV